MPGNCGGAGAIPRICARRPRLFGRVRTHRTHAGRWRRSPIAVQYPDSDARSLTLVSGGVPTGKSYEGFPGYQPQMAWWAEQSVWIADEFRDGNVPDFVPDWKRNHRKDGEAFRYIAIRVRSRHRDLLVDDDNRWRHFAVVTNMDGNGERLLRWQREKQGTVEHGHGVLKGEYAGGTMPCGRFGSNAAWWRLNVLVHNLTQLLKVRSLPPEMASLRPKALRFRIFNVVGVLVGHARRLVVRISGAHPYAEILGQARLAVLDMKRAARAGPLLAA